MHDAHTSIWFPGTQVSDFGDEEVFCNKCVPKQAPSQNSESIETDRTRKAAALFRDVGIVNEQLRGSEETKGVVSVQL